jgi:opacity protein-like surface antigen
MRHVKSLALVAMSVALLTSSVGVAQIPAEDTSLPFSCATFPPNVSAADLRARFGGEHVGVAPVPWGGAEGDYSQGTALFVKEPNAKLEISWYDKAGERNPAWVSVRGNRSRWRTPAGITLGSHLRTIEKLNAGPFRLLGFGTDVSGTVMSWSEGRLATQDSGGCRVRLRLGVVWESTEDGRSPLFRQLIGEREFSSGHPAMQSLNPSVYELFLQYR